MRVRDENRPAVETAFRKVGDALEDALTDASVNLNDPVADMVLQNGKQEIKELIDLMFWQLGH